MAGASTESPGNSSRSYEDARSGAHDECVNTFSSRSSGSSSMRPARSLLVRGDVVDSLTDRLDLLGVLVRDLDPELVLELHDQLYEIERVGVEVLLERRLLRDLALLDPELLGQDFFDPLEDFVARRCHLTSFVAVSLRAGRCYHALRKPFAQPPDHVVLDAAGRQPDRVRERVRRRVAVGDDDEAAQPE